jgi:hypothetical protein
MCIYKHIKKLYIHEPLWNHKKHTHTEIQNELNEKSYSK